MSDIQGDVFSKVPFNPYERVSFWHMNDNTFALKGKLDPAVRVLESHQETIKGETVTVIDKFEIIEVSIIP